MKSFFRNWIAAPKTSDSSNQGQKDE